MKPLKGDLISFYGTQYIVKEFTDPDICTVTQGNGIDLNLWWTDRGGCKIINKDVSPVVDNGPDRT